MHAIISALLVALLNYSMLCSACESGNCSYPIPLKALPSALRGYSFLITHEQRGAHRAILRAHKKQLQKCALCAGFTVKSSEVIVNNDIQNALRVFEYLDNQKKS